MIDATTNGSLGAGNEEPPEDAELLRRYVAGKSDTAFAQLVRRHVNLVYSVAMRQVAGDAHLAEDVTQRVFADFARKAKSLSSRATLGGWLYRSAHFAASDVVRGERRRRARETEAYIMDSSTGGAETRTDWEKLRPVLDAAIAELDERDRDAVALRFFESRSFGEVGARLRLTENAARMRVERALDKLHAALGRRGVTSTAAALGVVLAQQGAMAAPAGLAASVTGAALAGLGATAAGAGGWTIFMGVTKIQVGIVSAIVAAGATAYVMQGKTNATLQREIGALQNQQTTVATLRAENRQLTNTVAEVELLRRDDVELKQLAQDVTLVKKQNAETARTAVLQTAFDRRAQLEAYMQDQDRRAQQEVERMNQEGNALVEALKDYNERAKDPALTFEAKTQLEAAAKAKLAEIQAKQKEIQEFIASTRKALMESPAMAELRTLPEDPNRAAKAGQARSVGAPERYYLRQTSPDGAVIISGNPSSNGTTLNLTPPPGENPAPTPRP